jgi:protoheme IX farnesyltransferase
MNNAHMATMPDAIANQTMVAADAAPSRLADYIELTKLRMNVLVLATTFVGFFMASAGGLDWALLLHTMIGTALTAASAATLNQLLERNYDRLMPRTRNRPLAAERLPPSEAMVFGIVLGLAGVAQLLLMVNLLTAVLAALTLVSYLFIYTPLKRRTTLNTVVGAIPGALPPVMGFAAASGQVSAHALAVFGILFFWQLPHFLAIAILYRRDYQAGGFIMLPVVDETLDFTTRQILLWAGALIPVSLLPAMLQMTGAAYFAAATLLGLGFLSFGISVAATRSRADARKLFLASIIYLPVLLGVMMADKM